MPTQHNSDLYTMVHKAFSPKVAILCSSDADSISRKNNLSFSEMMLPFSKMTVEGSLKDPGGVDLKPKGLNICFQDFNWKPPAAVVAKKLLGDAVLTNQTAKPTFVNTGYADIEVPSQQTWYQSWRETFFNIQEVYEHEFMRHCVACVFVVSSSHTNPVDQFAKMNQLLNQQLSQASQPAGLVYQTASQSIGNLKPDSKQTKFFSTSIPRYFLLLHDIAEGDAAKAEAVYQSLKSTYGGHGCHLLAINSRSAFNTDGATSSPNPWLNYLPKRSNAQAEPDPPDTVVDTSLPICIEEGEQVIGDIQEAELMDAMREPSPGGKLRPSPSLISMTSLAGGANLTVGINGGIYQDGLGKTLILGTKADSQYSSSTSLTSVSGLGPLTIPEDLGKDTESVPQGACLNSDDLGRIQTFVNEFCSRTLLPSVERQIKELHDTVLTRKSAQRSIISATKRWFGGKPSQGGIISPGLYQPDSPQLQVRRLADLAFIFGHYDLAYQAYHTAKRDFESDQAWVYYAGALEMAALSVVMFNARNPTAVKPVPQRYFDEAVNTYTSTCKNQMLGLRSGILSFESLRESKQYGEAAKLCVKLTSEDSDLRSALMLEQAAYCFAKMLLPFVGHEAPSSVPRACKYAFHLILAGHRFAKAGQRRHASRVYKQALLVYQGNGWTLAEDHILLTLGRHMLQLKQIPDAIFYVDQLLRPNSKQAAAQQNTFLKEFVALGQDMQKDSEPTKFPELPVPRINSQKIRILIGQNDEPSGDPTVTFAPGVSINDDDALHRRWNRLEELVVQKAAGSRLPNFKPTVCLLTEKTNNTSKPVCFCQEALQVEVPINNDLRIPLFLENIHLLWKFKPTDNEIEEYTNEGSKDHSGSSCVSVECLKSALIAAESDTKVTLQIVPRQPGELQIIGLAYSLVYRSTENPGMSQSVRGKKLFSVLGPRLNNTQVEKRSVMYAQDERLNFVVQPAMPKLDISFSSVPDFMLCGELREISITISNTGDSPVRNLHVAYSDPKSVLFANSNLSDIWASKLHIPLSDASDTLDAGASFKTSFWIRASDDSGLMNIDLLFYYESDHMDGLKAIRYRLSRHSIQVLLSDSIAISAKALRSSLVSTATGFSDLISPTLNIISRRDPSDGVLGKIEIEEFSVLSDEWTVSSVPDFERVRTIEPTQRSCMIVECTEPTAKEERGCSPDPNVVLAQRYIANYPALLEGSPEKEPYESRDEATYGQKLALMLLESTEINIPLCIRWKTFVGNDENPDRPQEVRGQHCVNLKTLSKQYELPPVIPIVPSSQLIETKVLRFLTFDENGDVVYSDEKKKVDLLESEIGRCICYKMEYRSIVQHNFQQSRLCLIPVKIVVFNSFRRPVEVKIAAVDPRPPPRSQLYLPEALAPFTWIGPSQTWTTLQPRASKELTWSVCVSFPGTYCLDHRLKLDCRVALSDGETPRVFGQLLKFDFELIVKH